MKFKSINKIVKSENQISIREAKPSDAKQLIACLHSYLKSDLIPLTQEEINPNIQDKEDWINKFVKGKNDLLLVAEKDNQIIGNIDLSIGNRMMLKHTGYLGIGVHEKWQNKGLGTVLLDTLLQWVDLNPEIELVWLQVFANNSAGLKLYNKFGFKENGRQAGFIKRLDGVYIDNVIMTRRNDAN